GKPIPADQPVTVSAKGMEDFRLNEKELALFKENGFVVSERMGAASCTDLFYRIYKRDLPVIVTADSVLHAWHRSFDAILEEVETTMLIPALEDILASMAGEVPEAQRRYGSGLLRGSLTDADYFLAVARSLLAGKQIRPALDQDLRVDQTVRKCANLQLE